MFARRRLLARLARLLGVVALGAFLAAAPRRAHAQGDPADAAAPAALSGYVSDAATGETLIGANVLVRPVAEDGRAVDGDDLRGAATNTSGYYTLTGLAPGRYAVRATYVGYAAATDTLALAPGATRRLDLALAPEGFETEAVVVTAEAQDREDARDLGVTRVEAQDITRLPSVLEPDVFRALQLLPGVKAASDYSSGLYIRGGTPDQTLILLDNTTVYNPTHFFGFFSTFNPDAIKDVRLYKGGFPAEYGGRLGSVVSIFNKDGNRNETKGGLSVGLLASRAFIEGPYGKGDDGTARGSYMLAVRRSTLEPLLALLRSQEVDGIPDGFYFYDVNAKIGFDAGPDDRLSLAGYAGQDVLALPFAEDAVVDIRYGNRTLSLGWTHLFSSTLFSTFTATGSRYLSTPEGDIAGTAFGQRNQVTDLSLKADVEYVPNERHAVRAGAWGGRLLFEISETFDGNDTFDQRIGSLYGSAYVEDTFTPSPQWEVRAGLRLNAFESGSYWRLAPRLSVEYRPDPAWRLQAGYGRYYQFLTLDTSEFFTGFDEWLMVADGVPPAYGDQFVLGVKTRVAEGWQLDVESYVRTMRGLFEVDPFLPDRAGVAYAQTFRFGEGVAAGGEVYLQRTEGPLTGAVGYAFAPTGRRFPGVNLADAAPPSPPGTINTSSGDVGGYYAPRYDRLHDVTVNAGYSFNEAWRLTGIFAFATGQPFTEPRFQYSLPGTPFSAATPNVLVAPFNGQRLPNYHRLDLGVAKSGRFFGLGTYEAQLQVINVYSRRNIWFFFYEFPDDGPPERTEVPQIPVPIPNLSLTLKF